MPKLSVIIPTYRRPTILAECLRHLERQTIASDLEVIVVSDGQDAGTRTVGSEAMNVEYRFFEVPKSQQGAARNKGVAEARGEYVLFIGDDIFLEQGACEAHLKAHERGKMNDECGTFAVLGCTTWDPTVGITPVMRWLERSGWQFGYPAISRYAHRCIPRKIQHQFTYTSHISLPLDIAKKHPFRTDVRLYGWEDIEWGMRLRDSPVRLFYEPDAKALHHHHIALEDSLRRMEILGRSAIEISKKVPCFDRVPRGWKLSAYRLLSLLPTTAGRHRQRFLAGIGR